MITIKATIIVLRETFYLWYLVLSKSTTLTLACFFCFNLNQFNLFFWSKDKDDDSKNIGNSIVI